MKNDILKELRTILNTSLVLSFVLFGGIQAVHADLQKSIWVNLGTQTTTSGGANLVPITVVGDMLLHDIEEAISASK